MDYFLRVNMNQLSVEIEAVEEEKYLLTGGRGLTGLIISEEVPPVCDPLGPYNKLVIAPGLLAGGNASSTNRVSIGAKSPLTGGIKEANGGGTTALYLARHGLKAVIFEGRVDKGLFCLVIEEGNMRLEAADDLRGFDTFETADRLRDRYGENIAAALIGPAGEQGLFAAGVTNLDLDGQPNRYCARGGLGAVMGAKRVKALVIVKPKHSKAGIKDIDAWKLSSKNFVSLLKGNPATGQRMPLYGTSAMLDTVNQMGALPVNNFRIGSFEGAEKLSAQKLRDQILARGGKGTTTHACMPGCVIRCSNRYPGPDGEVVVAPFEYESIAMLGPNLGIDDFDSIAEMNRECNRIGLDTIETGATLGICAEAGFFEFGDKDQAICLLKEVNRGTLMGRLIGHGAAITAKVLGVERVPVVKGQAMAAYDPRAIKGNGVLYATSPMGADHTAGNAVKAKVDPLDPLKQLEISRNLQISIAAYDNLGICIFAGSAIADGKDLFLELLNARLGASWDWEDVMALGKSTLQTEINFNHKAGFNTAHDLLPDFFYSENLPPLNENWDISRADIEGFWNPILK